MLVDTGADHARTGAGWTTGMAATGRRQRGAAVLIALFEEDGETRVVLTVRSDQLRSHRGEVAFPGGRLDEGEEVVEGALRETYEEVGIEPTAVTVIGALTTMPTLSSDTLIAPVVGALVGRPLMTANPGEVARVFDVALADLATDGVFHEEWWPAPDRAAALGIAGDEIPVWFFEVAGETVWGATARCLTQLVCLVLGVPVPPSLMRTPPTE
jgi:8-oxo-dGTP pyrophosphatase MutT (NUDIX family)